MTRGRQRRKRRQQASRTPPRPGGRGEPVRGPSGAWDKTPTRGELQLVGLAVRRDWPVRPELRPTIVEFAFRPIYDDDAPARLVIGAALVALDMDRANDRNGVSH